MEYEVELYEKVDGKIPILDFILSLNPKQQAKIYREMEGEKYNVLWELRIEVASNAFRIFYFMHYQNHSVLLHGFQKKTVKTPPKELDIALNRMKDYIARKEK